LLKHLKCDHHVVERMDLAGGLHVVERQRDTIQLMEQVYQRDSISKVLHKVGDV